MRLISSRAEKPNAHRSPWAAPTNAPVPGHRVPWDTTPTTPDLEALQVLVSTLVRYELTRDQDDEGRTFWSLVGPEKTWLIIPDHHSPTPAWVLWSGTRQAPVFRSPSIPALAQEFIDYRRQRLYPQLFDAA